MLPEINTMEEHYFFKQVFFLNNIKSLFYIALFCDSKHFEIMCQK